ncbi:arginase family protein [Pyricularia oryzae]|uniref:Arginase family protein n=2 Tax=Pyricularia oryzae TaxID=318829 RepID=A0AA97P8M5_PYRO3|nr:arginase family protein [Pyricularia oryzae Y34]KAI7925532.1 arginase family protein [Pyricularia oryzae]KAI7926634.1 arginase family protein [Pyricularia oryzae]
MKSVAWYLVWLSPALAAWEFPRGPQVPLGGSHVWHADDVDIITGSQFNGLKTFGNLPYVNCFSDEQAAIKGNGYDIAVMGAPFDTSTTGRPGTRYGPQGIRTGSQRIFAKELWSIYTGKNLFASGASIVDCGDVTLTWLDNNYALKQLDKAHRVVSGRVAANTSISKTPRILTLGGDHTTTLSALRSTYQRFGPVSVIHMDSHIGKRVVALPIDSRTQLMINLQTPGILPSLAAEYLIMPHEEGLIKNTSIHAGIRAPLIRRQGDLRNDLRCGFTIITARDLDRLGVSGMISRIKERVGDSKVYISIDIDVLDPAFAPATGTAEPGGWSTRELLSILDGLTGLSVVGADVVEVAPVYDNVGETTVLAAAEVGMSLLGLMVDTPVKSK